MKTVKTTTVAAALGMVIAGSTVAAEAQASAFGFQAMEAGYQLVGNEGKCGEGKCGDKKAKEAEHKGREGKCGEGKCGEGMKHSAEGKAKAEANKVKEGKCGEAKCGSNH
ncbi:MAG: hypothetical protein Sw1PiTSA_13440 [Shewanella algae]|uniref:HvfA family oxazolone/thioamide-modified RiPP metallophore n=1 Tax=Shewanella algae TaxID=38313 RepID=UPI0008DDE34A|nr:hypothetical protein [Shewanella algae]MBO2671466.1 hypothetical protein [Shewanella algae]OHY50682.1 hypothetical protein BEH76_10130 [Shewanella algae]